MNKNKFICSIIVMFFITGLATINTNAASYNYDFWSNVIPSSEGLAHKDTYYDENIKSINPEITSFEFQNLVDLRVYNNDIYIIDSKELIDQKLTINGTTDSIRAMSYLYILNNQMQLLDAKSEFEITDSVKEQLAQSYGFEKELNEITISDLKQVDLNLKAPYYPSSTDPSKAVVNLSKASSVAVTDNYIYIADRGNSRILKMTKEYLVVDVILTPGDEVFYQFNTPSEGELSVSSKVQFLPFKITVDVNERVYAICEKLYEGIVQFSPQGEFTRFMGKNEVPINPLNAFWEKFMSDSQIDRLEKNLPPMFTNITIDNTGFLYTTSEPNANSVVQTNMIKSINTDGDDVLKRNGYTTPDGDAVTLASAGKEDVPIGSSRFSAIAVNDAGIYTAADSKRGRLFTYDSEGNLLYISGEKGELSNSINEPVAIDYIKNEVIKEVNGQNKNVEEESILVLDAKSKSIIVFKTTDFGSAVNEATRLYQEGNLLEAEKYWREVAKMDTNCDLAYLGIGKSLNRQGLYEEAMKYFKTANNGAYYSKAYQQYRDNILKENFDWIMTGIVVLAGILIVSKVHKQMKKIDLGGEE